MDFRFTPEEEEFRQEIRSFLDQELPKDWDPDERALRSDDEAWQFSRQFAKKLAERKYLAMAWPVEYGGLNATHMQQMIFNEEMAYRGAPGTGNQGIMWVGPALMLYGTDEQKAKYLPGITSSDDWWCTFYSEPGAGSDLASLQTRAVLDGDDWVINGQKIWTSGAHRAKYGWMAARTDPDAPKHRGISTFIVPMDASGITISPLINMAGEHGFNQVFFDNVRIPKENLVGELNRGWYQVAVALDFERSSISGFAGSRRVLERLVQFAREHPQTIRNNPAMRYRLVDMAMEINVGTYMSYRIVGMQSRGIVPNYEASMAKVFASEQSQRLARTGMQLLGMYSQLEPGSRWAPLKGRIERMYLTSVSSTIGGGTSEIQRNIIATRGLGLPRG